MIQRVWAPYNIVRLRVDVSIHWTRLGGAGGFRLDLIGVHLL